MMNNQEQIKREELISENLKKDLKDVVSDWMDRPDHRLHDLADIKTSIIEEKLSAIEDNEHHNTIKNENQKLLTHLKKSVAENISWNVTTWEQVVITDPVMGRSIARNNVTASIDAMSQEPWLRWSIGKRITSKTS